MSNVREALARYLRQQQDLDMPDHIFTPGFDLSVLRPTPVCTVPRRAEATHRDTSSASAANTPPRARSLTDLNRFSVARPAAAASRRVSSPRRKALAALMCEHETCGRCGLHAQRTRMVFGGGTADASLLVIGEAPGAEEDARGLPFVGRAGGLLTQMLDAIHLDRKNDVFITNIVKCRPPQNRNPESGEILACLPLLKQQIEIIKPQAILLLGRIAAHSLLERTEGIGDLRTRRHWYNGIPTVVTYHPAALLRQPKYKRGAWEDLQKLEAILRERGVYGDNRA
jgi:uracil-DNA glycosylase family 4